jgi:hypothetical protein
MGVSPLQLAVPQIFWVSFTSIHNFYAIWCLKVKLRYIGKNLMNRRDIASNIQGVPMLLTGRSIKVFSLFKQRICKNTIKHAADYIGKEAELVKQSAGCSIIYYSLSIFISAFILYVKLYIYINIIRISKNLEKYMLLHRFPTCWSFSRLVFL